MLEELLKLLADGPVVLNLIVHQGHNSKVGKYQVIAADAVGIVVRAKSTFGGGFGARVAYPWSGIGLLNLEEVG